MLLERGAALLSDQLPLGLVIVEVLGKKFETHEGGPDGFELVGTCEVRLDLFLCLGVLLNELDKGFGLDDTPDNGEPEAIGSLTESDISVVVPQNILKLRRGVKLLSLISDAQKYNLRNRFANIFSDLLECFIIGNCILFKENLFLFSSSLIHDGPFTTTTASQSQHKVKG